MKKEKGNIHTFFLAKNSYNVGATMVVKFKTLDLWKKNNFNTKNTTFAQLTGTNSSGIIKLL